METVEIPVVLLQNALDAMEWTFNPYLDDPVLVNDCPWIVELIQSFNCIASLLPDPVRFQYPVIPY